MKEYDLDLAFANMTHSSKEFSTWLLGRTKFSCVASVSKLLQTEQDSTRPKVKSKHWWRHWWCRLPDGSESETDIFTVFSVENTNLRFALHIENKPPRGKFTTDQELNYSRRANFMANQERFLSYSDSATILLAPQSFFDEFQDRCEKFDHFISYESVSSFIPEFRTALSGG